MITMYKQQQDASIGKADVGIGANGLKVFFSLSNYYNDYYSDLISKKIILEKPKVDPITGNNLTIDPILTSNKSFEKTFTINEKTRNMYAR